jgi:hypothetical protein
MPFRLGKENPDWINRTKVQFTTASWMPYRIFEACKATGTVSNTVYIQRAVCEALARDLNLPLDRLLSELPTPRGPSNHLYDPEENPMNRYPDVKRDITGGRVMIGPANTIEDVK